jgi:hypothetical protein
LNDSGIKAWRYALRPSRSIKDTCENCKVWS